MITWLSNDLNLIVIINKANKVKKDGINRIIKKLAKFKRLKNSIKYKKSIKNLFKFKCLEESSFLSLAARLVYTKLR